MRHLIVIDNTAIIAGFMIKSDNDTIPHWMYFLVEDNGEGSGTAPDRMRPYMPANRYESPSEPELMEVLMAELVWAIDVTAGNIQVR